jgi:aminoglycoside phosphotransferase family enzyme
VVVLFGDRAYKLKKPVDLEFVDFSDVAARARACRREVELNRRMAPDVYLGVAELRRPDGAEEPMVVMRRMPEERRLSTLVRRGAPVDAALRDLARQLAAFHARSARGAAIDSEGGPDRLHARWVQSFDQVRPFHRTVLDTGEAEEVERLAVRFSSPGAGPCSRPACWMVASSTATEI